MNQVFEPHVPYGEQLPLDYEAEAYVAHVLTQPDVTLIRSSGSLALSETVDVPLEQVVSEAFNTVLDADIHDASVRVPAEYLAAMDLPLSQMPRDALTGAYNRSALPALERAVTDRRQENERTAIVVIDLDNIKQANAASYAAADGLFKNLAHVISTNIRGADERGSDSLIRWGGDEFVLLVNVKSGNAEEEAQQIIDRLTAQYKAQSIAELPNIQPSLTASYVLDEDCDYFEQGVEMAMNQVAEKKAERIRVTVDRDHVKAEALRRFFGMMVNIQRDDSGAILDINDPTVAERFGDQLFEALEELDYMRPQ